ncbi:MAG TPA: DUF1071 domain-containing protein [Fusibacter sp.]|nr:DUF1071 domain-containing protein [Fusibacter sp.]
MDFKKVYAINVNDFTEKKNNLTYLSWANAWKAFVEVYPKATYKIVKDEQGKTYFGNSEDGYMVYTSVTVEDLTHEMWLPVMDFKNKSMMNPTTFDVNKAIMRCLTKNLAMFGLGLYIYVGEDIPNEQDQDRVEEKEMKASVKTVTLQDLLTLAESKKVTNEQLLAKVNNATPEKDHVTDVNLLTEQQIIGLYKLLGKVK